MGAVRTGLSFHWYTHWLVRAMVTASMHPDVAITLSYTGGILRRMEKQRVWTTEELQRQRNEPQAEDMAPESARPAPTQKVPRGKMRTGTPSALGATPSAPATATPPASDAVLELLASTPPADAKTHPAVHAYISAFKKAPNEVQLQQIIATVIDQAAWVRVLLAWRSHGWREGDVANMLDRYRKETGTPIPQEPGQARVSINAIIYASGIDPTARGEWLSRFRSVQTNEERRAVITAFTAAYPDANPSSPATDAPAAQVPATSVPSVSPVDLDDLSDLDDLLD